VNAFPFESTPEHDAVISVVLFGGALLSGVPRWYDAESQ
jgi:hypothetical protein